MLASKNFLMNQPMAIQFCRECNNLLYPKIECGILQYICNSCETTIDPADPIISSTVFKNRHGMSAQFTQHLLQDLTLPRFNKVCAKCSHPTCISYMEESEEKALNSYYVCMKCLHEWTD